MFRKGMLIQRSIIVFLISSLSLISGCGKQDNGKLTSDNAAVLPDGLVYSAEYKDLDYSFMTKYMNGYSCVFSEDGIVFSSQKMTESGIVRDIFEINTVTGELSRQNVLAEMPGQGVVDRYKDNYCVLMYNDSYELIYAVLDSDFNIVSQTDAGKAAKAVSSTFMGSFRDAEVDEDGSIYMLSNDEILVFDNEMNLYSQIVLEDCNYSSELVETDNGDIYVIYNDFQQKNRIAEVDKENGGRLGDIKDFPSVLNAMISTVYPYGNKICYVTDSNLYGYDTKTGTNEIILNLINYGVCGEDILDIEINEEGMVILIGENLSSSDNNGVALGMVTIKKVPKEEADDKVIIRVSTCGAFESRMYTELVKFQRENPKYQLEFVNYRNDDGSGMDFNGFTKDIINGEAADVILIPPEQIEKVKNLSSKGALEDLTSYLAVDEELSVSDFIPNILETMKTENGLYGISPKFTLKSIVVNISDIGTDIVWTPEGMMKLMENSDKPLIAGYDGYNTLYELLQYDIESYCDADKAEAHFDSERFAKLLEVSRENGKRNNDTAKIIPSSTSIAEKLAVLNLTGALSYSCVKEHYALYKDKEFEYIGYICGDEGDTVAVWSYMFCMSAQSDNKEAAWELIKYMAINDFDIRRHGSVYLPVLEDQYEEYMEYYLETDSTSIFYVFSEDLTETTNISAPALSMEQAGRLTETVYSARNSNLSADKEILNIVLEEAEYYFSGQKSEAEVVGIIQDRVQLYLDEQN